MSINKQILQLNIFGGEPTIISTAPAAGKINTPVRNLARLLIQPGHYMQYRQSDEDWSNYMVYHGNQHPVKYFSSEVGKSLKKIPQNRQTQTHHIQPKPPPPARWPQLLKETL